VVLTAHNGVEALSTITAGRNPDLILLDVMMPDMGRHRGLPADCRRIGGPTPLRSRSFSSPARTNKESKTRGGSPVRCGPITSRKPIDLDENDGRARVQTQLRFVHDQPRDGRAPAPGLEEARKACHPHSAPFTQGISATTLNNLLGVVIGYPRFSSKPITTNGSGPKKNAQHVEEAGAAHRPRSSNQLSSLVVKIAGRQLIKGQPASASSWGR